MKTFDRKDMFTIANLEDAKTYIKCEGYFNDCYCLDLEKWNRGILKQVNEEDITDYPFMIQVNNSDFSIGFRFFIPVDKVKKVEKTKKCLQMTNGYIAKIEVDSAELNMIITSLKATRRIHKDNVEKLDELIKNLMEVRDTNEEDYDSFDNEF
ncbi:MAG: hypothetical protein SPK70_08270 [Succinivibrio dextrinosolvens]|nr:hypothetical protein [Succinivibrio dextrinosolvens]